MLTKEEADHLRLLIKYSDGSVRFIRKYIEEITEVDCPPDVDIPDINETQYCSKKNCGCFKRDQRKLKLNLINLSEL